MKTTISLVCTLLLAACAQKSTAPESPPASALIFPGEEKHLANVRQLTFGGQNAEAYFSPDGERLVFQSQRGKYPCDEQYVMNTDGSNLRKVSTGRGRVTCGYFLDAEHVIYASTHDASPACPPHPDFSRGYVWPIYKTYELYRDRVNGGEFRRLTKNKAYDAEATVSPDGKWIVFTSTRHGDLDLYIMDTNGANVRRVTTDLGYDGGAFFSHDGKRLIYRAYHPQTEAEKSEYKANLKKGIYKPSWLELFVIDVDGTNKRQITNLRAGSFAPFLFPNDQRVIFASNKNDAKGRRFDLYSVNLDGSGFEQITFSNSFDAFPMFSPDGKKIVWASNRNGKERGETNIFIADWKN